MHTNISDIHIKPIRVKSEKQQSTRSLSRQTSLSNSSCEVYYGDASLAIPFRWESQPGTPKINFRDRPIRPLPPLTPPPSFQSSPARKSKRLQPKSNIFHAVLPKLNLRKNQLQSSPASSFSLSSSSSSSSSAWSSLRSVPLSPFTPKSQRQQKFSSARLSFDSRTDEDDYESPVSTLCFGAGQSSNVRSRGCSASLIKLLLGEAA